MILKEIFNYCLKHRCFEDVEIYINGKPAVQHWYLFKNDFNSTGAPHTLYRINLTDQNYEDSIIASNDEIFGKIK
jgi:hypothetical protein